MTELEQLLAALPEDEREEYAKLANEKIQSKEYADKLKAKILKLIELKTQDLATKRELREQTTSLKKLLREDVVAISKQLRTVEITQNKALETAISSKDIVKLPTFNEFVDNSTAAISNINSTVGELANNQASIDTKLNKVASKSKGLQQRIDSIDQSIGKESIEIEAGDNVTIEKSKKAGKVTYEISATNKTQTTVLNSTAGVRQFTQLLDAPGSYAGQANKVLAAKADGTGLEFITPSAGVTDHGALTGLADDDHTQYHNDARGDTRYHTKSEMASNLNGGGASLSGIEDAAGEYTATTVEGLIIELASRFIRKTNKIQKDQGYEQNSSIDGITADYISDKTLHNIAIKGHPATKQVGSFWLDTTVTPAVLHIYTDGETRDIKIDFTTEDDELEHQPLEFTIDVWSGNSNQLGCNGLPLVQGYKVSQGPYPVPILIDGGTF